MLGARYLSKNTVSISIKLRDEKEFRTPFLLLCFTQRSYRKKEVSYFSSTGSYKPFYDAQ
jgi:hypothetical protein